MQDSRTLFALALAALWSGAGLLALARLAASDPRLRTVAAHLRAAPRAARAAAVLLVAGLVAFGGTKPGSGDPPRGAPGTPLLSPPAEAPFAPFSVHTNGVALRAHSEDASEAVDWRLHGASEAGFWIESDEPFFAIGTNPVSRVYATAGGTISFESTRRPGKGALLPDGTGLPVLAPLLAPLGMAPEAYDGDGAATNAPCSRFRYELLRDGRLVLTWEDALLDRLPDRRISFQAELWPTGDFVFRYDFRDALDPAPTNLVLGAQADGAGVNALALLGSTAESAVVRNVDGRPHAPVAIADLLCEDGALRTPAAFAIRWKNVSSLAGLPADADTDDDGIPDFDEVFAYDTEPAYADTDWDGLSDGAELLAGSDPLDADEDGDGVPDGVDPVVWASDPHWADVAGRTNIIICLDRDVPEGQRATLTFGSLVLPLSTARRYPLYMPRGVMIEGTLFETGPEPIALSLLPRGKRRARAPAAVRAGGSPARSRAGGVEPEIEDDPEPPLYDEEWYRWLDDALHVFEESPRSKERDYRAASPELRFLLPDGTPAPADTCVHLPDLFVDYRLEILPLSCGLTSADATLDGLDRLSDGTLRLPVPDDVPGAVAIGSAHVDDPFDYGYALGFVAAHRCRSPGAYRCGVCGVPHDPEEACFHEPDCPAVAGIGDCDCFPATIRVSGPNEPRSRFLRFLGSSDCCCMATNDPGTAFLVTHSPNLSLRGEGTLLLPGSAMPESVEVRASSPSGAVPSEIRYQVRRNGEGTNAPVRVCRIWAVDPVFEPVTTNRENGFLVNPCGIARGGTAAYRMSLLPEAYPDEEIQWSASGPGSVSFSNEVSTGRAVDVIGVSTGDVCLAVSLSGYQGPAPRIESRVVEPETIPVRAWIVHGTNGPAVPPSEVHSRLAEANRIFRQVGLEFELVSLSNVVNQSWMRVAKRDGTWPLHHTICNSVHVSDGVKVFFVGEIDAADGLTSENGITVRTESDGAVLAHEFGHACGLRDIYVAHTETTHLHVMGDVSRDRLPRDWSSSSSDGFYPPALPQAELIERLLMNGISSPLHVDLTFGDVDGLCLEGQANPATSVPNGGYETGTAPIGFQIHATRHPWTP